VLTYTNISPTYFQRHPTYLEKIVKVSGLKFDSSQERRKKRSISIVSNPMTLKVPVSKFDSSQERKKIKIY